MFGKSWLGNTWFLIHVHIHLLPKQMKRIPIFLHLELCTKMSKQTVLNSNPATDSPSLITYKLFHFLLVGWNVYFIAIKSIIGHWLFYNPDWSVCLYMSGIIRTKTTWNRKHRVLPRLSPNIEKFWRVFGDSISKNYNCTLQKFSCLSVKWLIY